MSEQFRHIQPGRFFAHKKYGMRRVYVADVTGKSGATPATEEERIVFFQTVDKFNKPDLFLPPLTFRLFAQHYEPFAVVQNEDIEIPREHGDD